MALTRHSQLFRNATPSTGQWTTYEQALTAVKQLAEGHITDLRDGEIIIGRYNTNIQGQQSASGIVLGVVRVVGTTKTVDYIADERLVRELIAEMGDRIDDLDLAAETVGTLNTSATVSTVTLYNVSQENGQVSVGTTSDTLDIVMDGQYNATSNRVALESTVTNAIADITSSNPLLTITNSGKTYTFGTLITQTDGKNTVHGTESLVFNNAPSPENYVVTRDDITGLTGAMHYKGTVSKSGNNLVPNPSTTTVEVGDVYIASANFTLSSATNLIGKQVPAGNYEAGDMFVYNGTNWNVVTGENQVQASSENVSVGDGTQEYTIIGTVDGTPLKFKVSDDYARLSGTADADDATGGNLVTPNADFKVLNSVIESNGVISVGTAYNLKKVAATGAAADISITDSGSNFTATDVEGALAELAGNTLTVDDGDGISVTTANHISTVAVNLAANSVDSTTPGYNQNVSNLLVIGSNGDLSIMDTWDCGTY